MGRGFTTFWNKPWNPPWIGVQVSKGSSVLALAARYPAEGGAPADSPPKGWKRPKRTWHTMYIFEHMTIYIIHVSCLMIYQPIWILWFYPRPSYLQYLGIAIEPTIELKALLWQGCCWSFVQTPIRQGEVNCHLFWYLNACWQEPSQTQLGILNPGKQNNKRNEL